MRKFNLNWGVMLATIVLLGYTYVSFLGMLYKFDGNIIKAGLFATLTIVSVLLCIYVLVTAKVTKNKLSGFVGQIVFGIAILAIFLLSGGPFTSFLKVINAKTEIDTAVSNVKISTKGLDDAYNQYVVSRVDAYKKTLPNGDILRAESLKRHLSPETLNVCQAEREKWVESIGDMTIWNILLPKNLKYMQQCVKDWTNNYVELSSITYDDEKSNPFTYIEFDNSLNYLLDKIKNAGYSIWAIIVALFAAIVMMIPYWIAIPTKTGNNKEMMYK